MSDERTRLTPPPDGSTAVGPSYTEAQVAQILQRAARLERSAQGGTRLSLAEIEAIAREAGLDPSLVRLAAESLEHDKPPSFFARLAGGSVRRTFERVVDGEIDVRDHEKLLPDLRGAVHGSPLAPPQVASVGRALTVSARTSRGMVEITIAPRDGKTLVRIDVSAAGLAGGLFGGLVGGLGGGLAPLAATATVAAHAPAVVSAAAVTATLGAAFGLARTIFSSQSRALYREMDKLADALAQRLRQELQKR